MVAGEEQLELLHGGLEIVGAVGEAAAADHDEAQMDVSARELCS